MDRSLGVGYLGGSSIVFIAVVASLAVWRLSEGTVSVNTVATPRVEAFYWVTILFSQTLGTALGDWVADTNNVGYAGGAFVFGAAIVLIAALYLFTKNLASRPLRGHLHPHEASRGDAWRPTGQASQSWRIRD